MNGLTQKSDLPVPLACEPLLIILLRTALLLHEAKMLRHITQLDRCIEADVDHGRPTNAKNLMYWFGFDAMGDFVFNHPFGMLKAKKWHHILEQSYRAIELLGPFGPAPWLVHVGFHLLPRLGKLRDWHEMTTWCRTVMERRLQDEALQKELDMTYYLMMQEEQEQANGAADTKSDYLSAREHNRFWLQGDSLLIIVAGRSVYDSITTLCRLLVGPNLQIFRPPPPPIKVLFSLAHCHDHSTSSDGMSECKIPP